jgi:drug/metabolite transporter (DMT)-like permease
VLVALAAWALLGEELHTYHTVGGLVALAGVAWGLSKPKSLSTI